MLDTTVVSLALVPLGRELHLRPSTLAWVINGYGLAFAGLLLVGGRIADHVGRRRAFLSGIAFFGLACAAAGVAQGPGVLLTARLLQGAAAALVTPAAMGLLALGFPEGAPRARALAAWAAVSAVGGTTGVVLSGAVSEYLSWRVVFALNVGLVVVVLALGRRLLPRDSPHATRSLNVMGSALATGALFSLVYCLQTAATITPASWLLPVGLFAAFAASERRATAPLVRGHLHLRTAGGTSRTAAVLANGVSGFGFSGALFLLLLTFQSSWGWGAARAGATFLPFGAALLVGSRLAPVLTRRLRASTATRISFLTAAAGLVALATAVDARSLPLMLPGLVLLPLGVGSLFVLITMQALAGAGSDDASQVSALLTVVQQVGGAMGVAAVAASYGSIDSWIVFSGGAAAMLAASAVLTPRSRAAAGELPTLPVQEAPAQLPAQAGVS
ncbi:MAG: hypothetical protein QOE05_3022 [Actinomycetota bacterium]|nr:hypothetical protein [Actinomycetota bacterium]